MPETTIRRLRRADKSIPDRPRSPPRFAEADTLATTMYAVNGSNRSSPFRPCPTATLILEMCQSGEFSRIHPLMEKLPGWVKEDFRQRGLHNAVNAGHAEISRFFLEQGAKLDGNTVLRVAQSENKSIEIFELFVEYGWNVNTPGHGGHTVLGWVVKDELLVRWLLDKGADPNFGRPQAQKLNAMEADNESGFALDEAASTSTTVVFDLLIKGGAKREYSVPLHAATEAIKEYGDRAPMMKHLLELGFDIDGMDNCVRGPYGRGSPLMSAVRYRKVERARFLLENGADPYLKAWWGRSAFDEAQRLHDTEFLELFQEYCPVNKTNFVS